MLFLEYHHQQLLHDDGEAVETLVKKFGLFVPVSDASVVYRNTAQGDTGSYQAFHWCGVDGHDNEESGSEEEGDWKRNVHLDRSLHVGILESPPDHTSNGHSNTQPVEETEVSDQAPDVTSKQEHARHETVEYNSWNRGQISSVDHCKNIGELAITSTDEKQSGRSEN